MTETIARILVPVDFSASSDRALRYATMLASRFGATVELLHVVEDPFVTGAWSSEIYLPYLPALHDNLISDAVERLASLKTGASLGVEVGTTVLRGQPAQTIVEHATTGGFDLVVMGTHGRSGLSHMFMGSVAERVVRRARCPVMTVREGVSTLEEGSSTAGEGVV